MKKTALVSLTVLAIIFYGCSSSSIKSQTIGTQIWTTKNLNIDHFRNGDKILEAKTDEQWKAAGKNRQPVWCYYNNDSANGKIYGKLYNWYAVNDPRGLAPEGWHVPSDDEWTQLIDYAGGEDIAGKKLKSKSIRLWSDNDNGTDDYDFAGFPSGNRDLNGTFSIGNCGIWWSSSEYTIESAWLRYLNFNVKVFRNYDYKRFGSSVRCVKD